jgi:large subunit ribosomal protein L15
MKLHDLRPAMGAHRPRKRVGRGIAAGGGKTAGRGTKGQKARAGASIPAWFEGGQTPLQMRIPKLHGFKNRFRIEYEVVNLGRIAALVAAGVLQPGELPGAKKAGRSEAPAPITVNQEILRATGLVSTLKKPLKVLGNGDLSVALFVVADAFSRSAIAKIEAAGGTVQVLEVPSQPLAALGLDLPEPGTDSPALDAVAPVEAAPPAAPAKPVGAVKTAGTTASPTKPTAAKPTAAKPKAQAAAAARPKAPAAPAKPKAQASPAKPTAAKPTTAAKPKAQATAAAKPKAQATAAAKPKAQASPAKPTAAKPKAATAQATKPAKATSTVVPKAADKATDPTDKDA